MGFVSFKNWCVIFIFICVTTYCVSAFRLIRTSPQSPDSKKDPELAETKERVRKVSSWREEIISSSKEKHKNQTLKLHFKSKSDESDVADESDEHRTIRGDDQKPKIVLPFNVTREKFAAKDVKIEKLSFKENSVSELAEDDDEDDDSDDDDGKQQIKLKGPVRVDKHDAKLDKDKITRIHERHQEAKENKIAKHVEIKEKVDKPVKNEKGLDKEKIVKIHEKRVDAKEEKSKIKDDSVKEKRDLDKEKIAKIHERRVEAKEEKSKVKDDEPVRGKTGLDREKISKIHEKHLEGKEERPKVKDEPVKEKKGLDKEKISKIHDKRVEAKEEKSSVKDKQLVAVEKKGLDKEKVAKIHEKRLEAKEEKATKHVEIKIKEKPEEPIKEKHVLDKEKIAKIHEKHADDKKMKISEKKSDKTISVVKQKVVEAEKPKDKKSVEKKESTRPRAETQNKAPSMVSNKVVTPSPSAPKESPAPKQSIKESKIPEKSTAQPPKKPVADSSETNMLYYSLPSFSPNFDSLGNEECKKQGHILLEHLNQRKIWALKMFDSTAKVPSGILKGNLNQFGDYDQCVGIFVKMPTVNDNVETDIKISGKYCLANIDFEAEIREMKLSVHLAQGRSLIRSKLRDPGHFIPRFTTMRWGICIPSGCTAQDAEQIIEESIRLYNESSLVGINFDVSIHNDQCYVRKPPKKLLDYHYTTLTTLAMFATVVAFVFISSIRDLKDSEEPQESSKMDKVLMSFSLKRTLGTLLKREKEPDEIECIHGIRTIATFVLYIAHKLIPVGHTPFTNKVTLTEISNNPLSVVLRLSVIYTDSFLLLSGVLISYGMSKDMEVKGRIPWFSRMVARFIRLTPALLFTLFYYAYVMELLGEGPLWNTIITPNADLCKDYWWRNVLYLQNIFPFQEMCATHTHQLALDMQLSLVAPILVWLLYRKPLFGVFVTIILHGVSLVLRYYTTINYRLSLIIYHGISISQLYRTANMLYASSIHRATPYIAGVGLGVLLRQMKPNFSIHKVLTIIGWLVAGYFAGWTLYMPAHLSSRMYIYDVNEAAQHASLCSLGWTLALSWTIFACCADNNGYLNTLLSSRPMVLLSRISYTVYLTQFMVFFYNVSSIRSAAEFKINTSIDLSEIIIVIVISTIVTLFIDIPAQKIKGILLKSAPELTESVKKPDANNIGKVSVANQRVEKITENRQKQEVDDNPISEINDDIPISEIIDDEGTHNMEDDEITEQLEDDDDDIHKFDFEEIHKLEGMEDDDDQHSIEE